MNVLSLFDGMSCGRIALERAGIPVTSYYAAEIDKWAIKIAKKNYPDTIHLGDVRDVHDFLLPEIDLLIGGSPCQGFSFAGKMLNFDDPRSKLFFEFVRLKEELKPKWFLLENVKMKKESQDIITKYLGVEPVEINSALVSAQNRRRLYWTNIPFGGLPEDKGIILKDIILDYSDEKYHLSNTALKRIERKNYSSPKVYPDKTGTLNTTNNSGRLSFDSGTTLIPLRIATDESITGHDSNKRVYSDQGKSPCLIAGPGGNIYPKIIQTGVIKNKKEGELYRRLTPIECERLQTVPDNYTEGVSDTQRYRMLGNGWTVDVIAHIFKGLLCEYL